MTAFGIDLGTTISLDRAGRRAAAACTLARAARRLAAAALGGDGRAPTGGSRSARRRSARAAGPRQLVRVLQAADGHVVGGPARRAHVDGAASSRPRCSRRSSRTPSATSASGPAQAVVTIPAYFGDDARRATQEAGRLAGLEVLALLHEPTAACLAYRPGRATRTHDSLVYDLGGGTFDVSVVRFGPGGDEVLATAGDDRLGGKDWDDVLVDLVADRLEARRSASTLRDDLSVTATDLQERAREAKHALSRLIAPAVTLHVGGRAAARRDHAGGVRGARRAAVPEDRGGRRARARRRGRALGSSTRCCWSAARAGCRAAARRSRTHDRHRAPHRRRPRCRCRARRRARRARRAAPAALAAASADSLARDRARRHRARARLRGRRRATARATSTRS